MTDLSDPNILPLAKSSQPLNRILGAQTDENGVASYALFPLHVLDQGSGVITKVSVSQEDITAGQTSNGTLYVQSQDGQVHTSTVSFPAGAKGDKGDTGPQGPAGPPGESGDFATSLQLSNEAQIRADTYNNLNAAITNIQNSKISRSGDTLTGALYSTGTFNPSENVYATQPIGAALEGEEFYLQLVNDNNTGYTSGRLVLRDGGGNFHLPIQIDNYDQTIINGKLNVTGNTSFQNPVFSQGTYQQGNLELTQPIGASLNAEQFFLQLANDANAEVTTGRLVLRDGGGNYHIPFSADTKGNITTERGTHFLEGVDTGNGHVTLENIGSASGKTLATLDDVVSKVNHSGDTMSGNLIYKSDVTVSPWAATPQSIFTFQNSKALGAIFGQIRNDGNYQTLLYAQNVDGTNKAWGFRSDDGRITTPSEHILLEADDAGNGHLIVYNIGSASGKILATTDDIATLNSDKLSRFGDTSFRGLVLDAGNTYGPWEGSPQIQYKIGGGFCSVWGQVKDDNNIRLILGANNPRQIYQSWQFNPTQKTLTTPTGNNVLETGNIGAPRMRQCFRVQVFNGGLITWPVAFARDDLVVASFSPQDNGSGQLHIVNYLYNTLPNRFNCQVAIETINKNNSNQIRTETSPVTIDVTVEGWTA
ncbi:autotransporter outer membrane beta-barrel domain-containing protein [Saccharibacter floricola]|uniref:Uncharacterized protein n=1 Tax=Saccharibacter floricola DSM 15669 TaxID=1123227 RepID=A0ABQ0P110_9PROT|nr:hypothetical protein [Saccharibacter floricola]GBQ08736.1 hypothetical protein AA15669_1885 [Saccharibacter floricola DSM 15669]